MLWWFHCDRLLVGVEGGMSGIPLLILGAVLSCLLLVIMPWIMRKYVWDATGDDSFLIGHTTGILSMVNVRLVAKRVRKTRKSTRPDLKCQKTCPFSVRFPLRCLGDVFDEYCCRNYRTSSCPRRWESGHVCCSSRLELWRRTLDHALWGPPIDQPNYSSFPRIAEKVVPGAKPAFDVPILFNYRPNAVIIGFIVAMITSTILVIYCQYDELFLESVIVPLVITSFFECAAQQLLEKDKRLACRSHWYHCRIIL